MKKIILITIIGFSIFLPFLAGAITPGTIPDAGELGIETESPITEPEGFLDVAAGVVKWVYTIFFAVAVMYVLFAAYNYLSGPGEPEKIKKAHSQLIYAAIAIAVALLSVGFVAIIEQFLIAPGAVPSTSTIDATNAPAGSNVPYSAPGGLYPGP